MPWTERMTWDGYTKNEWRHLPAPTGQCGNWLRGVPLPPRPAQLPRPCPAPDGNHHTECGSLQQELRATPHRVRSRSPAADERDRSLCFIFFTPYGFIFFFCFLRFFCAGHPPTLYYYSLYLHLLEKTIFEKTCPHHT